jgi:N-hydroxyarylamine O-acetyltransferase
MIDLDAYFARLGYCGPRTATLTTLAAVTALHTAAIAFENLDPFLGRPLVLDVDALQEKIIRSRRGGYCFELNGLFKAALEALGFSVTGLAARVLWQVPADRPRPRTHMVLNVDLEDGVYLADVGFGGRMFAAPLKLIADLEQSTPTGMLRFVETGATFTLQSLADGDWHAVYGFTLEPHLGIDYEMANWFTSTHPGSFFRQNLLAERLTPNTRFQLFNRQLTRRHHDGRCEETIIASPAQLAQALTSDFEIDPPADAETIFARLPAP